MPLLEDRDLKGNPYLVPGLKVGPYPGELKVSQLLPGDVLVWYEGNPDKTHDLIRETTQGPYTHTGIYIGNGMSVDAGPQGVACVPVTELIDAFEVGDVMRYIGLDEDRRANIVMQALDFVGHQYAWWDAIAMTFRRDYYWRKTWAYPGEPDWTVRGAIGKRLIERRKRNGPPVKATYCSQMVIEAYAKEVAIDPVEVLSGVYAPTTCWSPRSSSTRGICSRSRCRSITPWRSTRMSRTSIPSSGQGPGFGSCAPACGGATRREKLPG